MPCSAPSAQAGEHHPFERRGAARRRRIFASLNVPGSLSSALQMTYFGNRGSCFTSSHFCPAGNPAPPMPRSPTPSVRPAPSLALRPATWPTSLRNAP